ncbi:hypothetical protein [Xanthomonas sp. NCPPB 2632]|uniref:hypothetical protein n=1 Tax=Xanthomonas sp. NCPPB 2632 TaxID=3240912 RepID=UPI003517039D
MDFRSFTGALNPTQMPQARSLSQAHDFIQQMQPFVIRPQGSLFGVYEGTTTHAMPSQGMTWTQHVAKTPLRTLSTKYVELFATMDSVNQLTRANKALVSGTGLSPSTLAEKAASTAASLFRINETTTAFGGEAIDHPSHDVGAGMMAEVLGRKWAARSRQTTLDTSHLHTRLKRKYPQLDSVEKMRKHGVTTVLQQVEKSRRLAARKAGLRATNKGVADVEGYVKRKFDKHGLGPVPDGVKLPTPDTSFRGGFHPEETVRVKKLKTLQSATWESQPFVIRPGGSTARTYETRTSQIAPTKGTSWEQYIATPSGDMSTTYKNLFPRLDGASDLGRANKALVKGGSDSLSPTPGKNTWRGKTYSDQAQVTASLLRFNETTTAFGKEALNVPTHDVGTGIMAEAMARKWQAKQENTALDMRGLGAHLTSLFPQMDTVEKLRKQGGHALVGQIATSRMSAAVAAALRGQAKGKSDLGEYVQRKFNKHGLGQLPAGWAAKAKGQ